MHFRILTIFPQLFEPFLSQGLVGRGRSEGRFAVECTDLRSFAINSYGQLDDTPYGGGSGMVLRPDAGAAAIEALKARSPKAKVVYFTPRGVPFTQQVARSIVENAPSHDGELILLCGRYEGIDERLCEGWIDLQLSMGDYVLMGGEVPAMGFIEAVTRLIPGVLGNPESIAAESFEGNLLEHPQYTKPAEFRGQAVPEVLLSGNHERIAQWRAERSYHDTLVRRPERLYAGSPPPCEVSVALIHHPVLDKTGMVITSSVTNLDISDIARSARTFGLAKYYIVHPTKTLRRLTEKICEHWDVGYGSTYNPNRKDALRTIRVLPDLDDVIADIELRTGKLPKIITTSAKSDPRSLSFDALRGKVYASDDPHLLLLGTGWGLTEEVIQRATYHLEPVRGHSDYNHLSVRGAAAIIFDRLFGDRSSSLGR